MNLLENLCLLKEMSNDLSSIKIKLQNSEEQRLQNLTQIFLWRNSTTVNHWCDELYATCHRITKAKNNKYPKYSFILQNTWLCWEDTFYDFIDNLIYDVEKKEHKKAPNFSKENLYSFMKDYHEWLSEQFNKVGNINHSEVLAKIMFFLDKYPIK